MSWWMDRQCSLHWMFVWHVWVRTLGDANGSLVLTSFVFYRIAERGKMTANIFHLMGLVFNPWFHFVATPAQSCKIAGISHSTFRQSIHWIDHQNEPNCSRKLDWTMGVLASTLPPDSSSTNHVYFGHLWPFSASWHDFRWNRDNPELDV